jgi:hypothetical protein
MYICLVEKKNFKYNLTCKQTTIIMIWKFVLIKIIVSQIKRILKHRQRENKLHRGKGEDFILHFRISNQSKIFM